MRVTVSYRDARTGYISPSMPVDEFKEKYPEVCRSIALKLADGLLRPYGYKISHVDTQNSAPVQP